MSDRPQIGDRLALVARISSSLSVSSLEMVCSCGSTSLPGRLQPQCTDDTGGRTAPSSCRCAASFVARSRACFCSCSSSCSSRTSGQGHPVPVERPGGVCAEQARRPPTVEQMCRVLVRPEPQGAVRLGELYVDRVRPMTARQLGPFGGPDDVVRRRDESIEVE